MSDFLNQLRSELNFASNESNSKSSSKVKKPLSVKAITDQIKSKLETNFSSVWVEGELSNVSKPSSGHCYATLKDSQSQIQIVIFKGVLSRVKFQMKDGLEVSLRGQVTVYPQRGNYQIIVSSLEPKGVGSLQLAYNQLKEKLYKEGLFDKSLKKELPFLPKRIGIVTSLTGAAIKDFLNSIKRRCSIVDVVLIPVRVQGEGSAIEIASAISKFNALNNVDVIVVGRGGGSLEDLWAFNEEIVARAIQFSEIPVVSAVGHEIDESISDFVADARAITPTHAAEICTPDLNELKDWVAETKSVLNATMLKKFEDINWRLKHVRKTLSPLQINKRLQMTQLHLDNMEMRLKKAVYDAKSEAHYRLKFYCDRLTNIKKSFAATFKTNHEDILEYKIQAERCIARLLIEKKKEVGNLVKSLEFLSPLKVISRGYSLAQNESGELIKDVNEVVNGQKMITVLQNGRIVSEIIGVDLKEIKSE